ncbi:MAG: transposase [Bacteroidales bacterium]|nr:transposase [Bacteroidales bacterium]
MDFFTMARFFADGGYRGEVINAVKNKLKHIIEVILHTDGKKEFIPLPKGWIVERTFAWFESYRRLSKDYEYQCKISENMVKINMIRLRSMIFQLSYLRYA